MEKKLSRQERERLQLIETVTQHAEDLFRQNGYENTTLDALALNCEYTKRTIYRYFVSKEDLYFAVLLRGHSRLLDAIRAGMAGGGSGYDKIMMVCRVSFDFFSENGWLFDLIAQLQAIRQKRNTGELPYFEKYSGCLERLHDEINAAFVAAYDDKSIRTDVDPLRLGFSSAFVLNGLFHMLRLHGDMLAQRLDMDEEQFIGFTTGFFTSLLTGRL